MIDNGIMGLCLLVVDFVGIYHECGGGGCDGGLSCLGGGYHSHVDYIDSL